MMVFNFGCFIFEMLTGLFIFPEEEPQMIFNQISEPFRNLIPKIK